MKEYKYGNVTVSSHPANFTKRREIANRVTLLVSKVFNLISHYSRFCFTNG